MFLVEALALAVFRVDSPPFSSAASNQISVQQFVLCAYSALSIHRSKILKIAAEKYERGLVEPGDIIWVTDADVAHQLG
jgi:hypothetical protein